ncbi:MAG: hypothetical protein JSV12_01150 [Candidatus Bathyarchaeota archaeon]|nr:MAG: hypothetical protein JSV12_01150 [Candidatus Bathyarchaeota archaeon]
MKEEYCKKCDKKLSRWNSPSRSTIPYCNNCLAKLTKHCKQCGKKRSFFNNVLAIAQHDFLCNDCWKKKESEKLRKLEEEEAKKKKCSKCAYSRRDTETMDMGTEGVMDILIGAPHVPKYVTFESWICTKFKLDVTKRLELAEKCTSYITQQDYEEKCLRGELDVTTTTCRFCNTEYDQTKAICPHCGAPRKQEVRELAR